MQADLAWFLTEEQLPLSGGKVIVAAAQHLCAELAPSYSTLIDAFAIPDHLLAAVSQASDSCHCWMLLPLLLSLLAKCTEHLVL